jgi:hypothetical protein
MAVKTDTIEPMVAIIVFMSDNSFEFFGGSFESFTSLTLNSDEFSVDVEDGVDVDGATSTLVSRGASVVKMVDIVDDVSINLIVKVVDGDLDVFLLVDRTVTTIFIIL